MLLSLLLLSLIVFDASDAFFVREHKKLANLDSEHGKKSATQVSFCVCVFCDALLL